MTLEKKRIKSIVNALIRLGGISSIEDIYIEVKEGEDFEYGKISSEKTFESTIRYLIQRHSSDSKSYKKNKEDLFYSVSELEEGFWGLRDFNRYDVDESDIEELLYFEGRENWRIHKKIERNQKLIRDAKQKFLKEHGSLFCEVCGFDFEEVYGDLGKDFIEAHHKIPISKRGETEARICDLLMVCSNCHRMIHRSKLSLEKNFNIILR